MLDSIGIQTAGDPESLCNELLGILGVSFSQGKAERWEATTYGGTRYTLRRMPEGYRLSWLVNRKHSMYANERSTFGDHERIADYLKEELERRGWRVAVFPGKE